MGFNFKATEPLRGDNLRFTTKSPGVPGTHLIDLGRMKGWLTLDPPVSLNPGHLDWEYSALTTKPLLHKKNFRMFPCKAGITEGRFGEENHK